MKLDAEFIDYLMNEALLQAELALKRGEVPIGAVLAKGDSIIARAHNLVESRNDPTAHAESLVIKEASAAISNWRLNETVLCCTMEPCTMCCGAIKLARIPNVIYGVSDLKAGAFGSIYDLSIDSRSGLVPRVLSGVREAECLNIVQKFFKNRRAVASSDASSASVL